MTVRDISRLTNLRFEGPGTGSVVGLGGTVQDGSSIASNVEPRHVQRVHADVVSLVLHLLQGVAGGEAAEVDGVARHHPHLAPVGQPQVFLKVLLMVQEGPDDNLPLQLQRHDLKCRQSVELSKGLDLKV